jgi:predicted glycosyl hydrolase (DUF1957 family)
VSEFDRILRRNPEWANMTLDQIDAEICRLQAQIEDQERVRSQTYRLHGFISPYDAKLFGRVWKRFDPKATISQVMTALRAQKRRSHIQQEALDTYDQHYTKRVMRFPQEADIDRVEVWVEAAIAKRWPERKA